MSQGDSQHQLLKNLEQSKTQLNLLEESVLQLIHQKKQILQTNCDLLKKESNNFSKVDFDKQLQSSNQFNRSNITEFMDKELQWISLLQPSSPTAIGMDKLQNVVVRVELPSQDIAKLNSEPDKTSQRRCEQTTKDDSKITSLGNSIPPSPLALNEGQQQVKKEDPKNKKPLRLDVVSFDVFIPKNTEEIQPRITKQAKQISMNNNHLKNQLCEIIKKANPQELSYLSLESDDIDQQGLKALVSCSFPKLGYLYLGNNLIADKLFFEEKSWPSLKYLSLTNNKITSKGLPSFGNYFKQLISLSLKLNPIGDEGLTILLSDNLQNLEYLHLQSCKLTNQATFLNKSGQQPTQFKKLSKVYFNGNNIAGKALTNLINSSLMKTLSILNLEKNGLKDEDIKNIKLLQSKLQKLTSLDLSSNKLKLQDIDGLIKIKLQSLDHLYLKNNELDTIQCLRQLKRTVLPKLRSVQIDGNKLDSKQQYIVKILMAEFYSATEAKTCKKIHIHV